MNDPAISRNPDRIRAALHELGEAPDDIEALTPLLAELTAVPVPIATDSTQQLLKRLRPMLPRTSKVRQAIAARSESPWSQLTYFLEVARAQVSILRPDFWFFSAGLTLFGALLTMSHFNLSASVTLWLVAPILAVLGVHYGFQSVTYGVSELEAACPISPLRLALARLIIILSYDAILLTALSVFFVSTWPNASFGALTLNWLAPLMLVAGLSLTLSLRFSLRVALTISYAVWMIFVGLITNSIEPAASLTAEVLCLLAGIGCLMVGINGQRKTIGRV